MQTNLSRVFAAFLLIDGVWAQDHEAQNHEPSRWTLSGRVVAADSTEPLAGCLVRITGHQATGYALHWSWLDWRDPEPITTGADGRFRFELPAMPGRGIGDGYPARIHLEVKAKGRVGAFGSRDFSFFLDEPAQDAGEIALPNGCARPFRVVDSAGVPQAGVLVYARPAKGQKPEGAWWGYNQTIYQRSDAQGLVAGGVMPYGEVKIEIKGRSLADTVLELAPTQDGETSRPIDLVVAPSLDSELIRGRVLDAAGGPVEGYTLCAIGSPFDSNQHGWPSARSRADGTFEISASGFGLEGKLQLSHPRNDRYDNSHEFGSYRWGDNNIEVRLLAPAKLQLLVRAGGKPVENLAVHAVPVDTGALGADPVRLAGTFRGGIVDLKGLRATRYAVRVHAIGGSSWPTDWIECNAEGTEPIVVDLKPSIERKLHVFTTEGRPVLGGRIELVVGGKPSWGVWGAEYYDRTMTSAGPGGQPWGNSALVADRGRTDRQGAVLLRCIPEDEPVYLVVEGGGAQKVVHELAGWSEGRGPILVTVPGGGELRGTITPAAFVTALDASPAKERKQVSDFGKTANAWRKSLEDFHAEWRPSIALRDVQNAEADLIDLQGVLADDGSFAIAGIPPGHYAVVLVVRNEEQGRAKPEVIAPPLGEVDIKAGEVVPVRFETPASIVERAAKAR